MLKAGGEIVVRWLHSIVNVAWRTGRVPEDWRKALVHSEVDGNAQATVASVF